MITTITAPLTSKSPRFPTGQLPLTVESTDVEMIQSHKYSLGAHSHPVARPSSENGLEKPQSLARLILRHHGVAVDDDTKICRKNMDPLDVSHDNICVPVSVYHHHLPANEERAARTISLSEYLKVFSIHRTPVPEADPCFVPVIDMDTAKEAYVIADADDVEWMTGMPVKFSEKGYPMVQKDWGKWTPLMHEQARRAGASSMCDPVVFRMNPTEPRDVRKHFIAIVTKDRMMTLA